MLEIDALTVGYPGRGGQGGPVLTDVSLRVERGEILALVGESGCGKSTLARTAVGLLEPDRGVVRVAGADVHRSRGRAARDVRRRCQMVFQDAGLSLSPRLSVHEAIREPLRIHKAGSRAEQKARVEYLLHTVGLGPELADRRPGQLSGGQRQRVAIARALALEPDVLICDEPVTALDVSIQAGVLNLLSELRDRLGLACLFIAHDLAVVQRLADRIAVMYCGRVVEEAASATFAVAPLHPYTKRLLAAAPALNSPHRPRPVEEPGIRPLPSSAAQDGCGFRARCPDRVAACETRPPLIPLAAPQPRPAADAGHYVACHLPGPGRPSSDHQGNPEKSMTDTAEHTDTWTDLLTRWDRQQDLYIEQRERRFDVMFDFLGELAPGPAPTVLDLACGPGAISDRLLRRYPEARAVAVDVDPVLLTIGQGACGDHDGRLRWVRTDLRNPDWVTALDEDGRPGTFDAVLSSTALHWLSPPELVAVYRAAATLLKPGGVLINADYLPAGPRNKRIRGACAAVNARRQSAALAGGAEDWETWWKRAESVPALGEAVETRRRIWPEGTKDEWASPGVDYHEAALREAGFAEVDVVWQDLEERVLIALMP
ncbi:oligopeptide/dipeptide ABC transporter ATP-binding protein [Streptomyces sp. WAC04114]|uniref:oligopeptide/dipeptide ABC transporter ATP-binding protein n=1 Tax=Streptomyces sp. WAC04114 TaxID=2867961 RepID=UPI001C8C39A9|nr:oligopeptide/dipeptide ABC transporter ATP-binding protein [Streptomyces sp. WAC04114]MBX9359640.1 ATP-binding cassette domain-containing protein [Streptomyces sp. WAC04114]